MIDIGGSAGPRPRALLALVVAATLALAACGGDDSEESQAATATNEAAAAADEHADAHEHSGDAPEADVVVEVEMFEFGYRVEPTEVPVGSTVRFDVRNVGKVEHEAVVGDEHVQDEAEEQMAQMAQSGTTGEHHHDVPSLTLAPGESDSLVVTFDEPGAVIIGCHIPGHWDAGMRADITVV